jgi:uncharacterized phage-like protein YoqJ
MILGITGHRPTELGGYNIDNQIYKKVYSLVKKSFKEINPEMIISGMALGADQLAIEAAIELDIPFLAAVPFVGQESVWPAESKTKYKELLTKAKETVIVSLGGYSPAKLHLRNHWIVNHSDQLLAIWNGKQSGGTFECVNYLGD